MDDNLFNEKNSLFNFQKIKINKNFKTLDK